MRPLYLPRDGSICGRAWMFLGINGGPCDQHCQICYYAHQREKIFYDIPTLMGHANLFRYYYGLEACDITGGEPTILPGIKKLVAYCRKIGLKPSIITHGQNLSETAPGIEAAGLEDWRISVHGATAEAHDRVMNNPGSYARILRGLEKCTRPIGVNTTLTKECVDAYPIPLLRQISNHAAWNVISFLPFYEWISKSPDFQVKYADASPKLAEAIKEVEGMGWEVNVRYWPYCVALRHGFARNVSGFHQVGYDPWEWRLSVTNRLSMEDIEKMSWPVAEASQALAVLQKRFNHVCSGCAARAICDMLPEQYARRYGLGELTPIDGEPITDPLYFQREAS